MLSVLVPISLPPFTGPAPRHMSLVATLTPLVEEFVCFSRPTPFSPRPASLFFLCGFRRFPMGFSNGAGVFLLPLSFFPTGFPFFSLPPPCPWALYAWTTGGLRIIPLLLVFIVLPGPLTFFCLPRSPPLLKKVNAKFFCAWFFRVRISS